jgi:hypothetical protein
VVNIAIGASSKDQSQGKRNDNQEEKNLDQRCYVFEPGEDRVWEEEDDEASEHEDTDYKRVSFI